MTGEMRIVSQYLSHDLTDDQMLEWLLVLHLKLATQRTLSSELKGG